MRIILVAALALVMLTTAASAQRTAEYRIGQGDNLNISVWRHPDLERTVVVRANGLITFPPIGDVTAAGLTTTDLAREIMQRLRDYTRETTQVTVTVTQFNSRALFLTGQVVAPGRYSFEAMPDVLQLLSQAGGPLPSADLSNVSIIRATAGSPELLTIDVTAYMRGESTRPLPELQPGDTVDVPSIVGASAMGGQGMIYIMGQVGAPGAYPAGEGTDLLQLISLAGGTTPTADLDKVAVIMTSDSGQVVAKVDLNDVIESGSNNPFMLAGGDRVFVPSHESSIAEQIWGGVGDAFQFTLDAASAWLLYLRLDEAIDDQAARDAAGQ
jgi:polysaccharide export outer membrane protein